MAQPLDIQVCHGLSCRMAGSGALTRKFEQVLGFVAGETSADGAITLSSAPCLGACGNCAAVRINCVRTTAPSLEQADSFLADVKSGRAVTPLPEIQIIGDGPLTEVLRGAGSSQESSFDSSLVRERLRLAPEPETLVVNAHVGVPGDHADCLLLESAAGAAVNSALIVAQELRAKRVVFMLPETFDAAAIALGKTFAAREFKRTGVKIELLVSPNAFVRAEPSAAREALAGRAAMPVPEIAVRSTDALVVSVQECIRATIATNTRLVSLGFGFHSPGLYEFPEKMALAEIARAYAPGAAMLHSGGPMGQLLQRKEWGMTVREALGANCSLIAISESDAAGFRTSAVEFCAMESCGKCTPCRVGSYKLLKDADDSIVEALEYASLCRLGSVTGATVRKLAQRI